ncbi:MAG: LamG domain-containing protein [Gammaproteobacteria bacterium]|nr:LamG domain-containing protein [Gammaproteobacteria bacterium]
MGLRFEGTNEIDVPDNGQFDWELGDEFSIEYWMRSTSDCNGGDGRQGLTHPKPHMWTECTGGPGVQGLAVFALIDVDGGRGEDSSDNWPRSNSPVTDGEWHHIVTVKTKTHIHLCVDGIKSSVAKTYTAGFASTTPLNIGYLKLGDGFHYNGDLDEVAYYSKALTDEEVMEHFDRGRMLGEGYCDKRRR